MSDVYVFLLWFLVNKYALL